MDLAILSKSSSWVSASASEPSYSGHSRAYRSGSDGKTVVGVAFPRYRHFFELNSPDSAL